MTAGFALNGAGTPQYNGAWELQSGNGQGRVNNDAAGSGMSAVPAVTASFSGADMTMTTDIDLSIGYAAWTFGGNLTAKAGTLTSPASATTVTASGLTITPEAALFILGPGALDVDTAAKGFGVGWLDASGGGSASINIKTGSYSNAKIYVDSGAEIAVLDNFAEGALTLDFTTADATQRLMPFIAFGN